jgi:translation initiation factor 1A
MFHGKKPFRGPLTPEQEQEEIARIKMPRPPEVFGVAIEMLGAGKIRVECDDGLTRICRIPGKMRKRVWVRLGDLILVEPWTVQSHERADVAWKYTRTQANWLKRKGLLKKVQWG